LVALGQSFVISTLMPLGGRDKANFAVPMFVVIPLDEVFNPGLRRL